MAVMKWKRPKLPADNKGGSGVEIGTMLTIAGVALLAWHGFLLGTGEIPHPLLAVIGGGALAAGVVILPTCLILRELRQAAF